MRSSAVLDQRSRTGQTTLARELLVLWQHPLTREIVPIGRLGFDGATYTFGYTRAAADIADLRPLPGLPDLNRRYSSGRLPAVFGQRVMDATRPDYDTYMRTLGLDPARSTPWEQIVNSGGRRTGDTLQFMELPIVENGRAHARFLANGVRHIPGHTRVVDGRSRYVTSADHEAALSSLAVGSAVEVEREDGNPEDPDALLVTTGGVPLAYVPRCVSSSIRELMTSLPVRLTVARIGGPDVAPHIRLVLDLDAAAPRDFTFDRSGSWELIHT